VAKIDQHKMKQPYLVDRDETQAIGFYLPFNLDNGPDSMTKQTLDAVRVNLKSLILTEMGERVMQPNLGIKLRKFLFEPFTEDVVIEIKASVHETIGYWLPFVQVKNIKVKMSDNQEGDFKNLLQVSLEFSLKKDPSTTDSVQITIGD